MTVSTASTTTAVTQKRKLLRQPGSCMLGRPALVWWNEQRQHQPSSSSSSYWNVIIDNDKIISSSLTTALDDDEANTKAKEDQQTHTNDSGDADTNNTKTRDDQQFRNDDMDMTNNSSSNYDDSSIHSLSYHTFIQTTICLSYELYTKILNPIIRFKEQQKQQSSIEHHTNNNDKNNNRDAKPMDRRKQQQHDDVHFIVVAIPEGIYVPITISAIHTITCYYCASNATTTTKNICFVPIDPTSDGIERIQKMIQTIQPIVILTANESDTQQLLSLVQQRQQKSSSIAMGEEVEGDDIIRIPTVINVIDVLQSASIQFQQIVHETIRFKYEQNDRSNCKNSGHDNTIQNDDDTNYMIDSILDCYNEVINATTSVDRYSSCNDSNCATTKSTQMDKDIGNNRSSNSSCNNNRHSNNNHSNNHSNSYTRNISSTYSDYSNTISHIVFTSGTTGMPKGCVSSLQSLRNYVISKNKLHNILTDDGNDSIVLLASSISFDPCLSDVIATLLYNDCYSSSSSNVSLALCTRNQLTTQLAHVIHQLTVSHILTTPTVWNSTANIRQPLVQQRQQQQQQQNLLSSLQVVALGGEPISNKIINAWRAQGCQYRLCATYGVTEACVYQTMCDVVVTESNTNNNVSNSDRGGQNVGQPFPGVGVRICHVRTNQASVPSRRQLGIQKEHDVDTTLLQQDTKLIDVNDGDIGEIVLYGTQVDEYSFYYNQPELSNDKFVYDENNDVYYYCTGDLGYVNNDAGGSNLNLLNRIDNDNMIKWNGIRVELGEIEAALFDDTRSDVIMNISDETVHDVVTVNSSAVVEDAMVAVIEQEYKNCNNTEVQSLRQKDSSSIDDNNGDKRRVLVGYVVLSDTCQHEMGLYGTPPSSSCDGILIDAGPLLALLRERCRRRSRATPSVFVIIPKVPQSTTGKRSRQKLPNLYYGSKIVPLSDAIRGSSGENARPLHSYGRCGNVVADQVSECLNLLPCQFELLTTNATFGMLGGDSLAATRVVRGIYASHHNVNNTRFLGGEYGMLDGPFAVIHLLRCGNLGRYVDWLDQNDVCPDTISMISVPEIGGQLKHATAAVPSVEGTSKFATNANESKSINSVRANLSLDSDDADATMEQGTEAFSVTVMGLCHLYDALVQACTQGFFSLAMALLDVDVDPNFGDHGGRLGKTSGRVDRRRTFRTSPMHLACAKGNPDLVRKLLQKNAKCNTPDASGLFPLHLAAIAPSGSFPSNRDYDMDEDIQRLECARLLLQIGNVPLSIKDGSKQTVLHAAARAGHVMLLQFLLEEWIERYASHDSKRSGYDWRDSWWRTPVHWAVLNGRVQALKILLDMGCCACPPKPKIHADGKQRSSGSSVAIESPMEICLRLYDIKSGIGLEIARLLRNAVS